MQCISVDYKSSSIIIRMHYIEILNSKYIIYNNAVQKENEKMTTEHKYTYQ